MSTHSHSMLDSAGWPRRGEDGPAVVALGGPAGQHHHHQQHRDHRQHHAQKAERRDQIAIEEGSQDHGKNAEHHVPQPPPDRARGAPDAARLHGNRVG